MLVNSFKRNSGFTLIELMIVVVIIGILTSLAIPRFTGASTRAKQSEARLILKQIYTMQHSYHQISSFYGDAGVVASAGGVFPQIGVEIMVGARYTFVMVAAANSFTCTATSNLDGDPTVDVWTIDQDGTLSNAINDFLT